MKKPTNNPSPLKKSPFDIKGVNVKGLKTQHILEAIKERSDYIDDLWSRIKKKAQAKGFGVDDIQKTIREVRAP